MGVSERYVSICLSAENHTLEEDKRQNIIVKYDMPDHNQT